MGLIISGLKHVGILRLFVLKQRFETGFMNGECTDDWQCGRKLPEHETFEREIWNMQAGQLRFNTRMGAPG